MKKLTCIALILIWITSTADGQSIVGRWKRTAMILEKTDGKTDDLQKTMEGVFPCMSQIEYVFESNGTQTMKIPKDCNKIPNETAYWKMNGTQIEMQQDMDGKKISTSYKLTFIGQQMIMTHDYTPQEQSLSSKRIIVKYQRL